MSQVYGVSAKLYKFLKSESLSNCNAILTAWRWQQQTQECVVGDRLLFFPSQQFLQSYVQLSTVNQVGVKGDLQTEHFIALTFLKSHSLKPFSTDQQQLKHCYGGQLQLHKLPQFFPCYGHKVPKAYFCLRMKYNFIPINFEFRQHMQYFCFMLEHSACAKLKAK